MFSKEVYIRRRAELHSRMKSGLGLFIGNTESPMNYASNTYHFRQDSDFLYYFGIDLPGFTGLMDFDSGKDMIFGNDFDMDDIIWMGPQPTVRELAAGYGITYTAPMSELENMISGAQMGKREIHFLPPYRCETKMTLGSLLRENSYGIKTPASAGLIKAVVSMRSLKDKSETDEIEKAVDIAYEMHTTAMKMCKEGVKEKEIFGTIEGIAISKGAGTSFPIILSVNGQTLHNRIHNNILKKGKMMLTDAGAETALHYASDITRTTPVGGKFSTMQKELYEIVLKANIEAINATRPGVSNRDIHILACKILASGLKDLKLMKGDVEEAVILGAHTLFMPHGIGHMLGLDVHDMEALGENNVGYNNKNKKNDQFGLAFLKFTLSYVPGNVFTIEPGCYFIPQLIESWKAEKKHADFINYDNIGKYMSIGGIRIEDNILITSESHKLLGKPIPKTVEEIENICS